MTGIVIRERKGWDARSLLHVGPMWVLRILFPRDTGRETERAKGRESERKIDGGRRREGATQQNRDREERKREEVRERERENGVRRGVRERERECRSSNFILKLLSAPKLLLN